MKHLVTYAFLIIIGYLSCAGSTLAADDVVITVEPNPIFVGETGQYTIVSTIGQASLVAYPEARGITWLKQGPSTSVQIHNFDRTDKLTYYFTVNQPGSYTIPAAQIRVGNKVMTATPITVTAKNRQYEDKGKTVSLDDLIFMRVTYNGLDQPPDTIYLGQEIALEIKLYVDQRLTIYTDNFNQANSFTSPNNYFPTVAIDNVVFRDYSAQNQHNNKFLYENARSEIIDSRRCQVFTYYTSISGVSVGDIKGKISHTVPILDQSQPTQRNRRDPFGDFFNDDFFQRAGFGKRGKVFTHDVAVDIAPIAVKSTPPDTNPEGYYLGVIGKWEISCSVDQQEAFMGEDVTLSLQLSGVGNIDALTAPKLELPGFRIYPPEITRTPGQKSTGSIKWVIIPLNVQSQIPKLVFKTFSPETAAYLRHEFQPKLSIKPSMLKPESGPSVEDYAQKGDMPHPSAREIRRASDILYIHKNLSRTVKLPLWRNVGVTAGMAAILGPLAYFSLLLFAWHRDRLQGDSSFRRRREALNNRRQLFAKIKKTDPDKLHVVVRDEVIPFLTAMLDLPPGASNDSILSKLTDPELIDMLKQAEALGFMPGSNIKIEANRLISILKKFAVICVSFFLPWQLYGDALGEQAAAAYDQGDIALAEKIYQNVLTKDSSNPAALYNLGNCAYRKGDYGLAIMYYERARRLAPRSSDITENLNFVRGQLGVPPVNAMDSPVIILRSFRDYLRPDEWLLMAGGAWLAFWLVLSVSRWQHRQWRLAPGFLLLAVGISIGASVTQYQNTYASNQAVVIAANTPIYRLPAEGGEEKAKLTLKAGEYVTIVEHRTEWSRVRIDQAEGWLKNAAIAAIW